MMMCKEATHLMSLKQDRPLTFKERFSLRMHLMMCGACRECDKQFALLHEAGERYEGDAKQDTGRDDDASV